MQPKNKNKWCTECILHYEESEQRHAVQGAGEQKCDALLIQAWMDHDKIEELLPLRFKKRLVKGLDGARRWNR